ncbi:MAG: gliding motility-associated C-terminal domain-containing protein [Lewinellaceae bacterium]|nr:gliding motility-associated C-terminal domain-containing protein [Phaeodactylibacter sp.]MCB9041796.1 gliding motility-associated C-terminal domain-containing protein [Lewinellaceae bacterium]
MQHFYHHRHYVAAFFLACLPTLFCHGQGAPDCAAAIVLCSSQAISFNPSGIGGVNDFAPAANNQGCLASGERNTAWYYFEFNNSMPPNSQITFLIVPNGSADYDFAVYGPGAGCNALGNPVRCSWAAPPVATGLSPGATDTSEGAGGDGIVAPLQVQPGQGFYLVVDNFSSNNTSFNLNWGGSAAPYLDCNATPPCAVTLNYAPTYNICAGSGAIALQGSILGGNGSETFEWTATNGGDFYLSNPFIANPTVNIPVGAAGTYQFTLMVTQGGCVDQATVTVTAGGNPMPSISGNSQICQGQATVLTASPGFSSYNWSNNQIGPSITVTAGATYTVTVTNGQGCQGTASYTVDQLPTPNPFITGPTQLCLNGAGILNANPGTFDSYQWSTGTSGQQTVVDGPGTYQVTVTQNGCQGVGQFVIAQSPNLQVTPTGDNTICPGQSATIDAGGPFATYLWQGGPPTQQYTVTQPGLYTVSVTNAQGCSGTGSIIVNPVLPPEPTIAGVLAICPGNSTTLDAGTAYNDYLWSTLNSNSIITVNSPGTYSVTVTNNQGCTGSASVVVTAAPGPMPAINGETAICPGESAELFATSGFASYQWSNTNTGPVIQANVGGTYTVTVTDAQGCTGEASIDVIENPEPAPEITGPVEICQDSIGALDAGPGFSSYLWSDSNGSSGQTLDVDAPGAYSVTVTNQFGCTGSDDFMVEELSPPVPLISGDTTFCEDGATTLTAEAGFASYAWPDGTTGPEWTVSQPGTYTVTVVSSLGCPGQNSIAVSALPLPAPAISGDTEFCPGASATFEGPPGFAAYDWSNNDTTQAISVNTAGAYSLTVTDANGCQGSASTDISAVPEPQPAISGDLEFCEGASTVLTATSGFSSYAWPGGEDSEEIAIDVPGTYELTVTDASGCEGTASVEVVQNDNPVPVINGPGSLCPGDGTALSLGSQYQSYSWSTGETQASAPVPGAGTYSVTVADANGCEGTAAITIQEFTPPSPPSGVEVEYCRGDSANLLAPSGFDAYLWEAGSTVDNINVSTAGEYAYTVTDANGCSAAGSFLAVENPLPDFSISGDLEYCEGLSTALSVPAGYNTYQWSTGSGSAGITVSAPGQVSVTVTDANGCSGNRAADVVENPLPAANINGLPQFCTDGATTLSGDSGFAQYAWSNGSSQASISVSQAGNYILTVTDGNGCSNSASVAVTEIPELEPAISGELQFCAGTSTTLQAEPGYQSYTWSNGSSGVAATVTAPGNISLTVIDNNGCEGTASVAVSELSLPEPVISGIDFFCEGTSTSLDAGSGYAAYAWPGNVATQQLTVGQPGVYTVTVTDADGCQGSGMIEVEEIPSPEPVISGPLQFCPEGSTELSTGNNYAAYLWSNSGTQAFIEVAQPGAYSLTVTDDFGCEGSSSVDVAHFPTASPDILGSLNYCPEGNTTLSGESGFTTYLWSTGAVGNDITINEDGAYGLTVTDGNGCQTESAVDVSAYPVSPPQIAGDSDFCAGGSAALQANAGFDAYSWSTGSTQPSISVNSGGIYRLTVTDANGCNTSSSFSVTQNPLPQVNIGGSTSYCIGGFTTLNAGAQYTGYNWSTGSSAPTVQVSQAGAYGLTVTDANGCVGSDEVQVVEDVELNPVISGPLAFCPGTSTTLDAGEGFQDYQWSDNSTTQTLTVNSPGSYSVTVADASGCAGDAEVVVSEYPAPLPVIEGEREYCQGESASLVVTGGNFAVYDWSTGAFDPDITVTQPGVYSVAVTDENGCEETVSATVQENPLPVFQISGALSFCQGDTTVLSAPAGFASYQWSTGGQGPSIDVSSPGNYGLTVTNSFGCVSQQAASATQIPQPQADAGQPRVINCYNAQVSLGGGGSSQGGNIVYQWAGPGINASNANDQFPAVSVSGQYTLTAINTSLGCASEPSSVEVSDNTDAPIVVLEVLNILDCTTSTALIDASNSSTGQNYTYQWFDGNMNPLSSQELELETSAAGTYFLQVVDTISGCDALSSVDVDQDIDYPIAEAGQPQHLDCEVTSASLNGAGSQQGASIIYNWMTTGGNILSGANTLNPEVSEPGTYIIMVTDTTNNCANTDTVLVTQDVTVPLADAGPDQEIDCLNPTVSLNGTGSSVGSRYTHQWAFGQPGNIVGSGLDHTADEPGTYFIIVTDTENGCANTNAVVVSQNAAAPSALNLALDGPTCFGDSDGSVVISSVVGGTPPYLYSFDGQPLSGQSLFANLPAGAYAITVQDAIGCEFEMVATLEDGNDLMVNLGEDRTVKLGEEVALDARVNIDESEIAGLSWNAADSLSCAGCLRPVVTPSTSGSYFVEVVDENGCVASDQVVIFVDKRRNLYVPNVFSPNEDGKNDVFMLFAGQEVTKIRSFLVFNRWGESVFEVYNFPPNDPLYGWDGTFRQELYNSGVFAWFAEVEFVDGVVEVFKGDVALMR